MKGALLLTLGGLIAIIMSLSLLGGCQTVEAVNTLARVTSAGIIAVMFGSVLSVQQFILNKIRRCKEWN